MFGTNIVETIDKTMSYLKTKAQEAKQFVSDILSSTAKAGSNFTIQGAL